MQVESKWWVTLYGPLGMSLQPLESLDKPTLMEMVTGRRRFKLETAEEVKARSPLTRKEEE